MQLETSIESLAAHIPDHALVAIAKEPQEPVALGHAIAGQGRRNLTLWV